MNLHKNARTCPQGRVLMVSRVLDERRPVALISPRISARLVCVSI
jgi:hypothetical protein